MEIINNLSLLLVNCKSMDFLLKVLPIMRDWFHVCVSVERVLTVSKEVNFDKTKSSRTSKVVIIIIKLFIIITTIHDPIYRDLIDDTEEQRTWFMANYPPSLQIFNSSMDVFHFFIPFVSISFLLLLLLL